MRSKLLLLLFAAACNDELCSRHTDCATNQMCSIEGKCVGASEATGDAGTDDGATLDASPALPDAAVDGGIE